MQEFAEESRLHSTRRADHGISRNLLTGQRETQTKLANRISQHQIATLLISGLLIREVFSFWTGHPFDFELWVRLGYAMVHGGDPYTALGPVSGLSFANIYSTQESATIGYLPFWPLITGFLYIVYSEVGFGNRFAYYFLLKQPTIAGDIVLAYFLYSYISSRTTARGVSAWALRFWLLSPFTLIISGVWGMFDSICMCFVLASIMATNYLKRSFWTGVGIFAKSLALIYALPTTIRKTRNSWGLLVAVGLPAFVSILTLVAMRWSVSSATTTLATTVVKSGGSMSVWDALPYMSSLGILPPLPTNLAIILGLVWIPAIVAFTVLAFYKLGFETDYGLVQSMLVVTLAFLIFKAQVTEQYAIYLLALSVIDVALWNTDRKRLLTATMVTALVYLFLDNSFLVRFLSPVYPGFMEFEHGLDYIEPIRLALLFASGIVFTSLNIAYMFSIMKSNWRQSLQENRSPKTRSSIPAHMHR